MTTQTVLSVVSQQSTQVGGLAAVSAWWGQGDLIMTVSFAFLGAIAIIAYKWTKGGIVGVRQAAFPIIGGTTLGLIAANVFYAMAAEKLKVSEVDIIWVKAGVAFIVSFASERVANGILTFKFKKVK